LVIFLSCGFHKLFSLCFLLRNNFCDGDYTYNYLKHIAIRGRRWRSWFRHCTTSRKVAGSIPDEVIGIFHLLNSSDRTMALG
jgi:hypothetical protein